ncbi:MAG: NUDIX hydrolase [Longimicrobiaceae bacterium]
MKKTILLYGLLGGVLIAGLEFVEYRFLVVEHSLEIYGGIVAALFAGLGIWLGLTRTLILDPEGRLLLFRYDDGRRPPFWATPGRQLLDGESFEDAAARELTEETGFAAPVGPLVRTRDEVFAAGNIPLTRWHEHYYAVRAGGGAPAAVRWTEEERRTIREARWWPLAELRRGAEPVLPAWLPEAHAALLDPAAGSAMAGLTWECGCAGGSDATREAGSLP